MTILVKPTGAALGAELEGIDLRTVNDQDFAAIKSAWLDHLVLLFRNQTLSDDEMIAFSRRFGELDWAPVQETGRRFVEGHPEIYVVSNVVMNGEPIGSLGAGEAVWHTDMSYIEAPPKASMLYALEVPRTGGDTGFVNMYRGYEAMPEALKTLFGDACETLRLQSSVSGDGTFNRADLVLARQGTRHARASLRKTLRMARKLTRQHTLSRTCRQQITAQVKVVRQAIPKGKKLRRCLLTPTS